MQKSFIFIDVDGTLVGYSEGMQYIPESARKAIHAARKNSHAVYLCTGRSLAELNTIEFDDIDGIIGGAGAFVISQGNYLYRRRMAKKDVVSIAESLLNDNIIFYLESDSGLYYADNTLDFFRSFTADDNYFSLYHPMKEANLNEITKICFFTDDLQIYESVRDQYQRNFCVTDASFGDMHMICGEISLLHLNKGEAIKTLLKQYENDDITTYAIGDSGNDIEMFEVCDHAIVMGNARKNIQQKADFITKSLEEDGLEYALKHYHLI